MYMLVHLFSTQAVNHVLKNKRKNSVPTETQYQMKEQSIAVR
jgi:hypothetical protein